MGNGEEFSKFLSIFTFLKDGLGLLAVGIPDRLS
jgi:hypothetical protein